jgi:hypothetical protein
MGKFFCASAVRRERYAEDVQAADHHLHSIPPPLQIVMLKGVFYVEPIL